MLLFSIKELVVVKAGFVGDMLELKAYVLRDYQIEEEMKKRVSPLHLSNEIKVNARICDGDGKSLYSGKRTIYGRDGSTNL